MRAGLDWERVAPFTGAWIETVQDNRNPEQPTVAPFTGAWIETVQDNRNPEQPTVAPFTGAWIETLTQETQTILLASRPLHGGVD